MACLKDADLAVVPPEGLDLAADPDFPRPPGWRPTARLLFKTTKSVDTSAVPRWELQACHSAGDASTACVYQAILRKGSSWDEPEAVVFKIRRRNPLDDVAEGKIEDRFRVELRAMLELANSEARSLVPGLYEPDGQPLSRPEPHEIAQPLCFCLAANHALRVGLETDHNRTTAGVNAPVRDPHDPLTADDPLLPLAVSPACEGCRNYTASGGKRTSVAASDRRKRCRPWIVSAGDVVRQRRERIYPLPATPSLIMSYAGVTLQDWLRAKLRERPARPKPIFRDYDSLRWLLETLDSFAVHMNDIHKAGWLHLDLNPNNLCVDERRRILIPIDFGQSERARATRDYRQTLEERVPFRQSEFVAPELQQRSFDFHFRVHEVDQHDHRLVITRDDFLGWPTDWFPQPGDLVRYRCQGHDGTPPEPLMVEKVWRNGSFIRSLKVPPQQLHHFRPRQDVHASIDRNTSAAADVYSFGLLALCLLFKLPRAVILREELSVVKRILDRIDRLGAAQDGSEVPFWFRYRKAMGGHSAILDECCGPGLEDLRKHQQEDFTRASLLFLKLAELGVRCVLRQRRNSQQREFETFQQVHEYLAEVRWRTTSPDAIIPEEEASLPISLQAYCEGLVQRERAAHIAQSRDAVVEQLRSEGDRIRDLTQHVDQLPRFHRERKRRIDEARKLADRASSVADTYQKEYLSQGVLRRWIMIPLGDLVASPPHGSQVVECDEYPRQAGRLAGNSEFAAFVESIADYLETHSQLLSDDERQLWQDWRESVLELGDRVGRLTVALKERYFGRDHRRLQNQLASLSDTIRTQLEEVNLRPPKINGRWIAEVTRSLEEFSSGAKKLRSSFRQHRSLCNLRLDELKRFHESNEPRLLADQVDLAHRIYESLFDEYDRECEDLNALDLRLEAFHSLVRQSPSRADWKQNVLRLSEDLDALAGHCDAFRAHWDEHCRRHRTLAKPRKPH